MSEYLSSGSAVANWGDPRLPDRFWSKCTPIPFAGCWQWTGALAVGYGRVWWIDRVWLAHRLAYQILAGDICKPDVDHLCRNTGCVNPTHLEPVTHRINMLRGGGVIGTKSRQSVCGFGHPLTADNVYRNPSTPNSRQCVICRRRLRRDHYNAGKG